MTKTWYMVPVRGGSVGLPRKNARFLGDKPLLCHVLQTIKKVDDPQQIVVITDDPELQAIAEGEGVRVVMEPKTTGKATLDDVCCNSLDAFFKFGATDNDILLTIQATCPFVSKESIEKAKSILSQQNGGSVITVMDDRHLNWTIDENGKAHPLYKARVNRQFLPPNFRESGAVIGSVIKTIKETHTRINQPVHLVEITSIEGLDIDDYKDWLIAEYYMNSRKIVLRADAGKQMGMGHVYRALTIAGELVQYQVTLVTKVSEDSLGMDFFSQYPYPVRGFESDNDFVEYCRKEKPDVIFLDQLSTKGEYVRALKTTGAKVVTFEDLGEGALEADLVVNDLYRIPHLPEERQMYGVSNVFLPSSFRYLGPKESFSESVDNILILFGGSDPSGLTERSLKALGEIGYKGQVTVVQGLGQKDRNFDLDKYGLNGEVLQNVRDMPKVMRKADLALSSAGRTVSELMYVGVPTMCICQNERELTHSHASQVYGVHNIGLGTLVDDETIRKNIKFLIDNVEFRRNMWVRASDAMRGHSNSDVIERIMNHIR
ncbi:MAG: NTP transferase domain-containing protein [Alphaproteobacteria bacterium]|nr:NTP transferase domain-containing protein [Alphaproteobacteria bacterium]